MPLSHISIPVPRPKFNETVSFYLSALAPLGYKEHARPVPHVVGLGVTYPDFWITTSPDDENAEDEQQQQEVEEIGRRGKGDVVHVAFSVGNRNLVHAFHAAALRAGATCNGAPGPRPQYFRTYYAAFVLDPVGNNIEAVCVWPGWTHLGYWIGVGEAFKTRKEEEKKAVVEGGEERVGRE